MFFFMTRPLCVRNCHSGFVIKKESGVRPLVLVLLGRSGCGKSTIAGKLIEKYGYVQVKTCTTRDRREGESKDAYHFMTREEFQEHIRADDFVEFDTYGDNLYGLLKSSLVSDENIVCAITPEGAAAIKKLFPDAFVVHVDVSMKTSVMRAIAREKELDPGKMDRISVRATQDYYLFDNPDCDFVLANPDGARLDDVVRICAEAHEKYMIKLVLNGVTDTLRECIRDLEEKKNV